MVFDGGRTARLMVIPPLFEEANKLRHTLVEVMRRLDVAGIDGVLPDLPGCNESLAPLAEQTLDGWRTAARAAAEHFHATAVLTVRGGALLRPAGLPGWDYAPQDGGEVLRSMVRARLIASKEAGAQETREDIEALGCTQGATLAGWQIGPHMFAALKAAELPPREDGVALIDQEAVGGRPPWLRAEPDYDPAQADAIAAIIAVAMRQAE
ncbi:hypothetical protein DL238_11405 [Alteriqipengyuania lutimaris]|uniref:Uncharacterized protein n=1 Tax=Alteriqipengyuania lutimaris TaxID=1538146 RepID=A0A395LP43_9SPHN|nr:hypothetical protein DL238_11405 [Alteriqipengyuania lutimaris]